MIEEMIIMMKILNYVVKIAFLSDIIPKVKLILANVMLKELSESLKIIKVKLSKEKCPIISKI